MAGAGEPVVVPLEAAADADLDLVARRDFKPALAVAELRAGGYAQLPDGDIADDVLGTPLYVWPRRKCTILLAHLQNFYVITRYNRSPLYAMAVHELSEEIRKGMQR
jgi:membrane-bound lytic murein transglycosylase B